ncbi:hypothetical protein [Sinorhizobium meliloti]|uniref:hypothetical protein n=1 Tax=Rhizobium meliloti TaxID=382 RepID=UPI0004F5D889|nr:hypothetical protein [Sinorhizobium meliloti]AIL98102.1 hypothetical protein DU99_01360 [Sinorhizobium meliloti]
MPNFIDDGGLPLNISPIERTDALPISARRQLLNDVFDRLDSAGLNAPTFSADEYLAMWGHSPHERQEIAAALGLDLDVRRFEGRLLLDAVGSMLKSETNMEAMLVRVYEAIAERGAVMIGPSTIPGCFSLFVAAGAYDHEKAPGEMCEVALWFETEDEAARFLAECVLIFLEREFGTASPAAETVTRPHRTILGGMLKALAAVDFIPEHPNTLRDPAHLMALDALADLRKRHPYLFAATRQ